MDRFTRIAVFVAAMDEGSLVAAGKKFGLSASMAGKYVSALEAELKVRLMHRSTRSLNLTEAGQAYYLRCRRILEEFGEANEEASDAGSTTRGLLRVAAPVTFGELHVGEVVARYLNDHPSVNVEVSLNDRFVNLQEAGIDVAIRIGRLPDSDLVARWLAPCQMVICASPAFLKREGTPRTPEELSRSPRLAFSEAVTVPQWKLVDKQQREHVIDGPLRLHANNMQTLVSAALAGVGIAYGPTFAFAQALKQHKLVPLLSDYKAAELSINAVYPSARYVPSKVRRFIDYWVEYFKEGPPWETR
jgi:DNA-binding transcriptional LysR family regulator